MNYETLSPSMLLALPVGAAHVLAFPSPEDGYVELERHAEGVTVTVVVLDEWGKATKRSHVVTGEAWEFEAFGMLSALGPWTLHH